MEQHEVEEILRRKREQAFFEISQIYQRYFEEVQFLTSKIEVKESANMPNIERPEVPITTAPEVD